MIKMNIKNHKRIITHPRISPFRWWRRGRWVSDNWIGWGRRSSLAGTGTLDRCRPSRPCSNYADRYTDHYIWMLRLRGVQKKIMKIKWGNIKEIIKNNNNLFRKYDAVTVPIRMRRKKMRYLFMNDSLELILPFVFLLFCCNFVFWPDCIQKGSHRLAH